MDDIVCREEANRQYFRDRGVEQAIHKILWQRFNDCIAYEYPDQARRLRFLPIAERSIAVPLFQSKPLTAALSQYYR